MCCRDFQGDADGGDDTEEGGYTPLLFAARAGDVESATRLLAAGASVEDAAPTGTSALVLAAHSDRGVFAAFLLEKGANPNADAAGYTALHAAVIRGNLDVVKALLAHGANANARQHKGSPARRYSGLALDKTMVGATPYLLAARGAQLDIMKALKAGGADVNLPLEDKTTPIMAAARRQGREGRGLAENRIVAAMTLALELGSSNIRVNAIAPGLVETKFASAIVANPTMREYFTKRSPLARHAQPPEIAGYAVFLLSDAASFTTGSVLAIDGGMTAT